mgnify:CR=1 FL=1
MGRATHGGVPRGRYNVAAVKLRVAASLLLLCAPGCGARSGLRVDRYDVPAAGDAADVLDAMDAADVADVNDVVDVTDVVDVVDVADVRDVVDVVDARDVVDVVDVGCVPVDDRCERAERCDNGVDDDCNGFVDEGCGCTPGAVQSCFAGPPGRRGVGACRDGAQTCEMSGRWGPCFGGILPRADICNGVDNLCNGCSQQNDCEIRCPAPGDPRVPDGVPFRDYTLRGRDFYEGPARAWRWTVEGGPCDRIASRTSFQLDGATTETATLHPLLSGDYRVTLTVVTGMGRTLSCAWIVHVAGPGLRVEMCYPESTTIDLDLFLSRPGARGPWYPLGRDVFQPTLDACGWHNCEATLRGAGGGMFDGGTVPRADWGYANSALSACENGPHGMEWRALGFCANPRLDIDNNLSKATGVPENINVDAPREGETFRVMVHNFSGNLARPLVNVYCAGRRVATYGASPDEVPNFLGDMNPNVGAMWRVADITTHVSAAGVTTCDVTAVHPPGTTRGYDVTYNNPRF